MITIIDSLGTYENSNNEKIEIIHLGGDEFQIRYENGEVEDIHTVGHFEGWWNTTKGSIKFFGNYLLLSHEGNMIGKNPLKYHIVKSSYNI